MGGQDMEEEKGKCKYEYGEGYGKEKCQHPVFENDLCIFHLPKEDKYEETKQKKFYSFLKEMNNSTNIPYLDFRGIKLQNIDISRDKMVMLLGSKAIIKQIDFGKAEIDNLDCRGMEFKNAIFWKSSIREARFQSCKFGKAFFEGAVFQYAGFGGTVFEKANFSETTWRLAIFSKAKFVKANFNSAKCEQGYLGEMSFSHSRFGDVNFINTYFTNSLNFTRAEVFGKVLFEGRDGRGCFANSCVFNDMSFKDDGKIVFDKTNLYSSVFYDTDLSRLEFKDVTWYVPAKQWPKRQASLRIEFEPLFLKDCDIKQDYSKIGDNYRQLVLNYERKREFLVAEQFHIGEMEIRRKQKGERIKSPFWRILREWFNEYNLYRILNNYGTSYWQAFWVQLAMFAVFSGIFLLSGFDVVGERTVNYNFGWGAPSWLEIWHDLKEAIRFTLSILPFQRSMRYEPYGILTEIYKVLAVLVFSSQFALLLLAVRRRFKR
jgi:uncharacterized protein YjbI with pentapeptide repeats